MLPSTVRSIGLLVVIATCCHTIVAQFNQCSGGDGCINIRDCAQFGPFFNEPGKWSDSLKADFRKRVCQREKINGGNVYKVCCPRSTVGGGGGIDARARGMALLDLDTCGPYTEDRIAFGQDAKLFQYPWMALLKQRYETFVCGGTLINLRYVLTAAHCVKNIDIEYVRLGEYDLSSAIDCDKKGELCAPAAQDIPVEQSIFHDNYSGRYKVNDIGLLRLSHEAELNDNVIPICLPVTPQLQTKQKVYFVAGWGKTESADFANKLQFTKLNLMPNAECDKRLKDIRITDSQMCAIGANFSDNCVGDSGGPLKSISINARYVQYGVVSVGLRSCGVQSAPGVYTKVESYIDWILEHLHE